MQITKSGISIRKQRLVTYTKIVLGDNTPIGPIQPMRVKYEKAQDAVCNTADFACHPIWMTARESMAYRTNQVWCL